MAKFKKLSLGGTQYFKPGQSALTKLQREQQQKLNVQPPTLQTPTYTKPTFGITPVGGQVGKKMSTAQYFGPTTIGGAGAKKTTIGGVAITGAGKKFTPTVPPAPPPPPVKPTVPPLTTVTTKWGVPEIMDTVTQSISAAGGLSAAPTAAELQGIFAPLVGRMKASTQFAYSVLQSLGLPTGGWHPRFGYRNQAMMATLYETLGNYMRQYYPDITNPEPRIGGEPPPPGLGTTRASMV